MRIELGDIDKKIRRNRYSINGELSRVNTVNIENYPLRNIGDTLGPVIASWMLEREGIDPYALVRRTKHLMTVGSVIGMGLFDSTVWGSGILNIKVKEALKKKRMFFGRKLDIRAVRGPLTREAVMYAGYSCPQIYGDPAILMPLIYNPESREKKYKISVILHYRTSINNAEETTSGRYKITIPKELINERGIHFIDPKTDDYKSFVDEIVASEYVIASSLHGIILAESYQIPTTFLNWGMDDQPTKFRDWYLSTGRELSSCHSVEEALNIEIPALPSLSKMQRELINSFPYDLWGQ